MSCIARTFHLCVYLFMIITLIIIMIITKIIIMIIITIIIIVSYIQTEGNELGHTKRVCGGGGQAVFHGGDLRAEGVVCGFVGVRVCGCVGVWVSQVLEWML